MVATAIESTLHDTEHEGDSGLSSPESQQVSPVDEATWASEMEPRRLRWEARAVDPSLTRQQRRYAFRRARRLRRPYVERLDGCARAGVLVKCACPGKRDVRWYACRQHVMCERCQRQRSKRMGARVRAGLENAHAQAPKLMAVLITISVRHTGDIGADRASLARGWRRFYRAYHRRFGAFPYVGTHEITPGRDKLGHPHAHIVALWPFRDWSQLAELWRAACPESTRISFVASRSVRGAAKYVSKYISKGVQTDEFSPELRARILAGTYQTRWLMSSVRFWVPFVPVCRCCKQPVQRLVLRNPWHACDPWVDRWRDPEPAIQLAIETLSTA